MKILRAYILREHFAPFVVTMGGLTAVLLIGNIIRFTELVVSKGVSPFDIVRLILYLIPYLLSFTVPMACLVAMTLAFGRLSTDYELIAMRASGVAPIRLVFPLLLVGAVISVALVIVNDRLVPTSHLAFRRQLKAIGVKQPTAYLEAGTFIKEFSPYLIFVYRVEGQKLEGVRIYEPQPNGPTRTIIADHGEFQRLWSPTGKPVAPSSAPGGRNPERGPTAKAVARVEGPNKRGVQLRLYDGTVDEWDLQRPGSFYKVNFTDYTMALRTDQDDPERMGKKLKEMTFKELLAERHQLAAQGIETLPVSLELHRKIAASFAALIFVAFGLSLGLRLHHHERLTSYLWVLGIFMAYYLASIGMNAVALKGWVAPWLAMWCPNFVGGIVSSAMIARAVRR